MTLAAVTALSKSCLSVENQHRRIAHLVLVWHFDEFFVCLLNPVSVIAVSGVDQTVRSPEILSPSRLNPVLASRAPHGETHVLVLNGLHIATDCCNGRHYFAKLQLEENRGLSCGIAAARTRSTQDSRNQEPRFTCKHLRQFFRWFSPQQTSTSTYLIHLGRGRTP